MHPYIHCCINYSSQDMEPKHPPIDEWIKKRSDIYRYKYRYICTYIYIHIYEDKDTTLKENHSSISLMNKNVKVNKILVNCFQQYMKNIIHHHQVEFIVGCNIGSISANQLM